MTSKLTREETQEIISALRLTPTSTVNGISLGRLADALSEYEAALDSEPVAWVSSGDLDSRLAGIEAVTIPFVPGMDIPLFRHTVVTHDGDCDADPFGFARRSGDLVVIDVNGDPHVRDGMPLYRHAQPAPVVPVVPNGLRLALSNAGIAAPESDEMLAATCEKHIQALVTWVKDRKPFQSAPVVPSFEEWLSAANQKPLGWVKDAMREAYDACRAAMLQAGNSPVIPDGYRLQPISEYEAMCATVNSDEWPQRWIPVSEQMPGSQEWVIVFAKWANQQVLCWDDVQNRWTDFEDQSYYADMFSHWMPLPAAPQEARGDINALIPLVSRNEREVK
ncbi:DUF551 domain-containing protein [Raoultella ornithinolytica]|uniref:DUF551 domain-containing protein n=1 Tax=Raoultella ornithinolytica TaxID=54291 RepID=UPI002DC04040|nr:DUF551 domain-containing protein [Raoultella ornithinolytica]MEB6438566.1 DUF551 domain-containing protein [Raoultella ornithinolytica]